MPSLPSPIPIPIPFPFFPLLLVAGWDATERERKGEGDGLEEEGREREKECAFLAAWHRYRSRQPVSLPWFYLPARKTRPPPVTQPQICNEDLCATAPNP